MSETIAFLGAAGIEHTVPAQGATIAQAIYTSSLAPAPGLCSGLGRCGRCAMRFLTPPPDPTPEDVDLLSMEELDAGWRLGCRHAPRPGQRVELPAPPVRQEHVAATTATGRLGLAVDLGTTSLHWRLQDLDAPEAPPLAEGSELNPQMGAGSEIMSRLAYAAMPGNAERLRKLVLHRLKDIADQIQAPLEAICIAGNTAMTSLLLGKPLDGLSRAPYHLDYQGGESKDICAPDNGCSLPQAYIPPQIAPFVGGDISAGLAAVVFGGQEPPPAPWLLADFGTNGEFALMHEDSRLLVASVALGPAIEGIGLSHGGVAAPGAVSSFDLTPAGLVPRHIPGEAPPGQPPRITGAGYISLLQRLLSVDLLDEKGHFAAPEENSLSPLARRLAAGLESGKGLRLALSMPDERPVFLRPADVEEVLKVKAACNTALSRLLQEAGLVAHQLGAIFVAGALGQHVGVRNLEELGFIPPGAGKAKGGRVRLLGNASLAGASIFLKRPDARDWACALATSARVLDLADEPGFSEAFFSRMRFTYVP